MKLVYYIIFAVFVGAVLSFAYISATAPQPVLTPKTIITPVPTSDPVYTEQSVEQTELTPAETEAIIGSIFDLFPIMIILIVGLSMLTMFLVLVPPPRFGDGW